MSNINLRDYLDQIDNMLEDRHFDEAIFHCRHLLQQQPRNIAAYRRLGRGLMGADRWAEAGEVLRRVLSVSPDDQMAHLGLSRVYRQLNQPNEAIWHMERAWEHAPNTPALSQELRDMIFSYRKVEDIRLQLTAGAVARQYARNGLYDQAVALLVNTLREASDRVDLRILLVRVLRERGDLVDAAETALDILGVLPDCLEANVVLAELWLREQRPSDARRYLSRIEPVDPYTALKLAQGKTPPDDAIELDYGDYESVATREQTQETPDWLGVMEDDQFLNDDALDTAAVLGGDFSVSDDDLDSLLAELDSEEMPGGDDLFDSIDEDVDIDALLGETNASDDLDASWIDDVDTFGVLSEAGTIDQDEPPRPPASRQKTGLTGLLSTLAEDDEDDEPEAADDFELDLFPEGSGDTIPVSESNPVAFVDTDDLVDLELGDDEDPLDWLTEDTDLNILDEMDAELQEATSGSPAADQGEIDPADPLAWARQSGIEVVDDGEARRLSQAAVEEDDDITFEDVSSADPLAWMKQSGVEIVEGEGADEADLFDDMTFDEEADADADPLAWMKENGVELAEDDEGTGAAEAQPSTDPLKWMKESGIEMVEEDDEPEPADDAYDDSLLDEMFLMESLASGEEAGFLQDTGATVPVDLFEDDAPGQSGVDGDPDWFDEDDEQPPMAGSFNSDEVRAVESLDGQDLFAWADEDDPFAKQADPVDATDWQDDMAKHDDDMHPLDSDDAQPDDAEPGWPMDAAGVADEGFDRDELLDMGLTADDEEDISADFGIAHSVDDDDDLPALDDVAPDWLTNATSDNFDMEQDGESPDWLANVTPDDMLADDDEAAFALDDDALPGADADSPDWLAGVVPDTSEDDADDGDFDWFGDEDSEEEASPEQPLEPAGDMPDWLANVSPDSDDEADWLEGTEDETTAFHREGDAEAQPMGDVPDWLAAVGPEAAQQDGIGEEDALDWLPMDEIDADTEDLFDDASEAQPMDDVPDWLAAINEDDTPLAVDAGQAVDEEDDDLDWLDESIKEEGMRVPSALETDEDAAFLLDEDDDDIVEAVPDWLAAAAPLSDADEQADDDELVWLAEDLPVVLDDDEQAPALMAEDDPFADDDLFADDTEGEAVLDAVPDWLNAVRPEMPQEVQADDSADNFDWLDDAAADDAPAAAADWLATTAETDDDPFMLDDDQFDDDDDDFMLDDEADEAYAFDEDDEELTPDWLMSGGPTPSETRRFDESPYGPYTGPVSNRPDEGEEPEQEEAFDDAPEWMAERDTDSDDMADDASGWFDEEDEGMVDAPDWLKQMSGADVDAADEPAAGDWLDGTEGVAEAYMEDDSASDLFAVMADADTIGDDEDDDYADDALFEQEEEEPALLAPMTEADEGFIEEIDTVPAENAPDWLNAMVPGLDVDFEAQEDAPVERSFLPESTTQAAAVRAANQVDFDWLVDIVEEESSQRPSISMDNLPGSAPSEAQAPAPTGQRRGRFVFSRPPAWLEKLRGRSAQAPAATSTPPADEEAVADLPPWLANSSLGLEDDLNEGESLGLDALDIDELAADDDLFDDDLLDLDDDFDDLFDDDELK